MGTTPTKHLTNNNSAIESTTNYEMHLLLIEQAVVLPSSFSFSTQKLIQQIEALNDRVHQHPYERYIIYCLNQRFSRLNVVNDNAFGTQKLNMQFLSSDLSKFQTKVWKQLQNKELFFQLLINFKRQYQLQIMIKQEFQREEGILQKGQQRKTTSNFETLRKSMVFSVQEKTMPFDEGLLMRLYYHFYLRIMKNNANSENKNIMLKFHQQTGRLLCFLIFYNYLTVEELFQLVYQAVYIDKHGPTTGNKLAGIHQRYYPLCLKNYYSINAESKQLQIIKAATRLYLDELYLNSIREAEDPDIKSSDDTLMPIKMFPISRVKDKPKN